MSKQQNSANQVYHQYQLDMQARTKEPIEWVKVSREWILRWGGRVAKRKIEK